INLMLISIFVQALKLQQCLVKWQHESPNPFPILLMLQHDPVYTVGLRSSVYTEQEESNLLAIGADFVRTNRGGLITFHGPGQLVVYPIFNLGAMKLGVREYVYQLEETIINLCERYKLHGERSPHTGVWIANDKICAMGINTQRGITSHGLALNCNTDLKWFDRIVPCGIHGRGVTSLSRELSRDVTVENTLSQFLRHFAPVFGSDSLDFND
uniref:Octanoyl-[acyl-carrier-protein]:protein N-octanoyltransferase LIPT2, mitochondrial n=2 Tax=Ciona savignyi TaxID=51511 RepID=H2YHG2_CIOSA